MPSHMSTFRTNRRLRAITFPFSFSRGTEMNIDGLQDVCMRKSAYEKT